MELAAGFEQLCERGKHIVVQTILRKIEFLQFCELVSEGWSRQQLGEHIAGDLACRDDQSFHFLWRNLEKSYGVVSAGFVYNPETKLQLDQLSLEIDSMLILQSF